MGSKLGPLFLSPEELDIIPRRCQVFSPSRRGLWGWGALWRGHLWVQIAPRSLPEKVI